MDPQGRVTQSDVVHTNGTCTTTSARTVSRGYLMQSRYVLILYETDTNTSPKGQNLMTTINSTEPDLPVSEIRWLFATPTPPNPGRPVPRHSSQFMGNPVPGCGEPMVPTYV